MQKATLRQCAKILYELTHDVGEHERAEAVAQFAMWLRREGLTKKIDQIADAFVAYSAEMAGERTIDVTAARPLTNQLANELHRTFGSEVTFKETIEPTIVGGLIIRDGDTIYDGSVKTTLARLKERFIVNS